MRSPPNIALSQTETARDALTSSLEDFVSLRRWLHAHPELAYQEHETAALIAGYLRSWGYAVEEGIGGTGVVGRLEFGDGKTSFGFRADIDALPIVERTELPYASRSPGNMHACGHDGHTAILLAAAYALAHAKTLSGIITVVFQPAEEGYDGAQAMVSDGLFDRYPMDAIFGLHNLPGQTSGQILLKAGPYWAGSDAIEIELSGKSAHGAQPHLAQDVISAGAALVQGLNTIVSRNINPIESAALTIGVFEAGAAWNVIPDRASLQLSLRSFDIQTRATLLDRIEQVVSGVSAAMNVEAVTHVMHGCPPVTNDSNAIELAKRATAAIFASKAVSKNTEMMTLSDDFSVFQQHVPGAYIGVGNGFDCAPLHHPEYDFNDKILETGAALWIGIAEEHIGQPKARRLRGA